MKIFIVSPTESVVSKRGDRHPKLANAFVGLGHKVEYISSDFYHAEKRYFSAEEINKNISDLPYKLILVHTTSYKSNVSVKRTFGYIKLSWISFWHLLWNMQPGDILIVPCRPPELIFMARLLKLFKGIRFIMDVRDVWPDGLPLGRDILSRAFSIYCRVLNRIGGPGADYTFYTAVGFLEWTLKFVDKSSTAFVPLGYDADRWKSSVALTLDDFPKITVEGSPVPVIKLVFVGDFAKAMEIDGLVRAVAGNPRYTLTFIGGGERLQEVKALVAKLGCANIDFLGRMSKDDVVAAMACYHVSVIPLKVKFSMPNKLFDAIGAKRPLLVFGKNDAADFVVSNNIGWALPFGDNQEFCFLNTLTPLDIVKASDRIENICIEYSKNILYTQMADKILSFS